MPSVKKLHNEVDLAIIHGGQGTVYTAAYAGKPTVGFPMQLEQHMNLEKMVGHGTSIMLSRKYFDEEDLLTAINNISSNYDKYLKNAKNLSNLLSKPEGDKKIANKLYEIMTENLD